MADNNGRTDSFDVAQIRRNREVMEDSTYEGPITEEVIAGDADYAERLFDEVPEDKVGFMPNRRKK
jgi:hypothetical protein